MSRNSSRLLRHIFAVLGLLGLGFVLWENRSSLRRVIPLLSGLRWYMLLIIVVVQVGSYWLNALYYRSILRIFDYEATPTRLFKGALATNFVNYLLPSAGLAGAGYLSQVLAPEIPRGVSILVQLMRYALSALSVLLMLPIGLLLVSTERGAGSRSLLDATVISALTITILAVGLLALVHQEVVARRALNAILHFLARFFKSLRRDTVTTFMDQFYVGYRTMTDNKRRMLGPFLWSILYIVVEIATFSLAFLALGKAVSPGPVVMAYLFANIVSIVGGALISTGVFELGMAGTLVTLGVPFALAATVTTVYRTLNLLVGLPPGYIFYRQYLPAKNALLAPPDQSEVVHPIENSSH